MRQGPADRDGGHVAAVGCITWPVTATNSKRPEMGIQSMDKCAGGVKLQAGKPCPECGAGPRENGPRYVRKLETDRLVLLRALRECEEHFDDKADADDGIPNDAMRALVAVREALAMVGERS
jgi:hypothetical protein